MFSLFYLSVLTAILWRNKDVWKNKTLEQKRFFSRQNDVQSVANGDRRRTEITLHQILEFKSMKLNLLLLPQFLPAMSPVVYIWTKLYLSARKTLVYSIRISHASVATCLRCGNIFNACFISNFRERCQ